MTNRPNEPRDPRVAELAALLGRRRFLGVAGAASLGAVGLAACGTAGTGSSSAPAASGSATGSASGSATPSGAPTGPDKSDTDKVVNFSNWQGYIDVDEKDANKRPTLDQFKAKTGITVNYTEDVNDNETFYAKIAPALRAGQDTGVDLTALTDWMAARLIRQNFVQKLDKAAMPNVSSNIIDSLKSPSWDPNRDFTAPWQSGLTGIAYRKDKVPVVKSITELLTRPDLKGRVTVLTEYRDTIGLIMLEQGKDPAKFTDADFDAAIGLLQQAVDSGQIRSFTGNDYKQQITAGSIVACLAWSGDIVQAALDNPNVTWSEPEAGMMIWSDNFLIPALAAHTKNAQMVMDWYYDPKIAAELSAFVQYISPVKGTQAEMEKIDPELAKNPLIFPTDEFLKKTSLFMGLDEATEKKYAGAFARVSGN